MFAAWDPENLMLITLVAVTGAVVFWRTMIKFIIIGAVTLSIFGLLALLQSLH